MGVAGHLPNAFGHDALLQLLVAQRLKPYGNWFRVIGLVNSNPLAARQSCSAKRNLLTELERVASGKPDWFEGRACKKCAPLHVAIAQDFPNLVTTRIDYIIRQQGAIVILRPLD